MPTRRKRGRGSMSWSWKHDVKRQKRTVKGECTNSLPGVFLPINYAKVLIESRRK